MNWIATSVVSAALLLGGCAGSRYGRPDVAIPPSYRGDALSAAANGGDSGSLGELKWQDLIHDQELAKLIREALSNNFDAQIAAARVLEVSAQFTISLLPSVDAQGGFNTFRSAEIGGASGLPPGVSGVTNYSSLSANIGWELDLWGQIRNAKVAAWAGLLASEQAQRAVLETLVGDVASAYFLLLDLDQEIEITGRALKLREDSLELVQLRVEYGYSSEMDLRQAEVLVKSARTALTELQLQNEQTENQIGILLGRNPGPIARVHTLLEQELAPRLPAGLPSTLLERRPDIRQAEQQLIADHALLAVAKAEFFPKLSLTSSIGFESSALLRLFSVPSSTWSFGPPISLPIFNAGRIRAGVRVAQARRQQSLLFYQKTVQQAFREVADSLAGCRRLAELRTEQEGLVESLRAAVELADLRYKGGVSSYLEYLDSERELLDAELRLVQIRREELTNVVTLYRALGGGWQ